MRYFPRRLNPSSSLHNGRLKLLAAPLILDLHQETCERQDTERISRVPQLSLPETLENACPPKTFLTPEDGTTQAPSPLPNNTKLATFITVMMPQMITASVAVIQLFRIFVPSGGDVGLGVVASPSSSSKSSALLVVRTVIYLFLQVK